MTKIPAYQLPLGTLVPVGFHHAEVLADMDFETYSEAGFRWDEQKQAWKSVGSGKGGIFQVGAPAYSEHPSTEVLSLAYNLKDGRGERVWVPGMPPPLDLFDHIARGGLVEAHNSGFEWLIWANVCTPRMGWPVLPLHQLRCSAAKCRAFGLPGGLGRAGFLLDLNVEKDKEGARLIKKFSCPRTPTKTDPRKRITAADDPADAGRFVQYNVDDIRAESELSAHVPDLNPTELQVWLVDQSINMRGVGLDTMAVNCLINVYENRLYELNSELRELTFGCVTAASKRQDLINWLEVDHGVHMASLDEENVSAALKRNDLTQDARRALEIRAEAGLSSVKKLYAMRNRVSHDDRIRDLFVYCGASTTGRYSGQGPQPQNLPSDGPRLKRCEDMNCRSYFNAELNTCPVCGAPNEFTSGPHGWSPDVAEAVLADMQVKTPRDLANQYGNVIKAISGCLRALFVAGPGKDLICSDYSSIEAVVLAALAGEQWRMDVFNTHGRIYEMSASMISGVPFDEMMAHKGYDMTDPKWWLQSVDGPDHPLRKKLGKFAELASGYQGGIGAWKAFGADKHMTDDEIKAAVKMWRDKSPMIVKLWYAMEDCAVRAVQCPGEVFTYRGISWCYRDKVLYCQLLSGRMLCYQKAFLRDELTPWGQVKPKLYYYGTEDGKTVLLDSYGGKLVENITQATARDILAHALVNLEARGYLPVLHVHDEPCSEVPEGWGSVQEYEFIMCQLPKWAEGWPIKASGGWRGKRFRKD